MNYNYFKKRIADLQAKQLLILADSSIKAKAAGIIFLSDNKILLIKRAKNSDDYPLYWAFPAGKIEQLEKPVYAAMRECQEEIGVSIDSYDEQPKLLDISDKGFYTFLVKDTGVFNPVLNDESVDSGWFAVDILPQPMHAEALKIIKKVL